jgi:hypothetical protein
LRPCRAGPSIRRTRRSFSIGPAPSEVQKPAISGVRSGTSLPVRNATGNWRGAGMDVAAKSHCIARSAGQLLSNNNDHAYGSLMLSGATSLAAEVVLRLILGALETCLYILIASLKPWRYLLSRSFRARINAQYAQCHPLLKWWSLVWGTSALLASIVIVATTVWFVSVSPPNRAIETIEHRRALHEIGRAILRKATDDRPASQ